MSGEWVLIPMRESVLPEVLEIERLSFTTPWPGEAFLSYLEAPDEWAHALAIVDPGRPEAGVRGYICFWTLEQELTIQNIAVHPEDRRRGGAERMIRAAFEEGRRSGCLWAYLEVRPSNEAALRLYRRWGFAPIGRRRGYYEDTGEDALVMRAEVGREDRPS
jgi:ribosomal-protein-alanine N-acetyltransferase